MKLGLTIPKESDEQKLAVEYAVSRGLRPFLIMIPNGTQLPGGPVSRAKYMNHLKSMGLRVGAFDLFLAYPRGKYHGAWFEMKRLKDGRATDDQIDFGTLMQNQGYYAVICDGFQNFRLALDAYLVR